MRCKLFGHRFRWFPVHAAAGQGTICCERCGRFAAGLGVTVTTIGGGGSGSAGGNAYSGRLHVTNGDDS